MIIQIPFFFLCADVLVKLCSLVVREACDSGGLDLLLLSERSDRRDLEVSLFLETSLRYFYGDRVLLRFLLFSFDSFEELLLVLFSDALPWELSNFRSLNPHREASMKFFLPYPTTDQAR
ncbi:hypothetical protein Tco_0539784 [Tanacetum coccineum]